MNDSFFSEKKEKVLAELSTSEKGLNPEEVKKRQAKYGLNELPKAHKDSILEILLRELKEPIEVILLITIIISLLTKEYVDAAAIFFIVIVDIIIGIVEELKAQKNAESLQNMLKIKTVVLRDNKELEIDAAYLVPGDIVLLSSGNKISADMRLIENEDLSVDESLLTGESTAVSKVSTEIKNSKDISISNIVYAGTSVIKGRAKAVVIKIGLNTELGSIASTVNNVKKTESPLEIRMAKFTKQISIVIVFIAIILAIILYAKNTPVKEIFLVVVALAVSAMPEGLPLAQTMALTIGSNRMFKKNVLVKNLNAVEALGSCTVIASDKTGTLTKNEQTAKIILMANGEEHSITGSGYNKDGTVENLNENVSNLILNGYLNNEAKVDLKNNTFLGDSIDVAFLYLGLKINLPTPDNYKILKIIPYESEKKYSAVFYELNKKVYCTVKGSPEKVLEFSKSMLGKKNNVKINNAKITNYNESLAKEGYRVIAIASTEIKMKKEYQESDIKDLNFLGLVGFIDPIREESLSSVETCKKAGIKVLMITGDHPLTACKIAKDLKLITSDKEVATKEEMDAFQDKTTKEFAEYIKDKKVFARVTPIDKYAIVEALKKNGEFVAVTGDGVNDAPALKSANIGIAMGSGTDVAKDTAKMILMNDNFLSIVEGIKEGRNAYNNIRKISYLLLSCGFAEVMFFILAIALNLPMPLVAIQLLWLNVVTDGIQDIALSFEEATDDIMKEHPRNPKESIFNNQMIKEIIISGGFITFLILAIWYILVEITHTDLVLARGYIMCLMVFIQNLHVLNCRSEKESIFKYKNHNLFVPFAIISCILLQFIVSEIPFFAQVLQITSLDLLDVIVLFGMSISILLVMELYKALNKAYNNQL